MSAHEDALVVLGAWVPPTDEQHQLREVFLHHLRTKPGGLERGCLPDHVTASTLIISPDGARVLLMLHARAKKWFQFGGHVEPEDETLLAAAQRETDEEAGLVVPAAFYPTPLHLDIHDVPFCASAATAVTRHLDVRFLAVADPSIPFEGTEESDDVRWWPTDELPSEEESLRDLVRLAQARLATT